jgi:hypothetical protein
MRFAPDGTANFGTVGILTVSAVTACLVQSMERYSTAEQRLFAMRLWLSMPNSRTLPAGHQVLWRAIEAGALRGGIGQSGVPV